MNQKRLDHSRVILLIAREPKSGQTKTRLGAVIGMENAAALSLAMLRDLCRRILQVPQCDGCVCLDTPDGTNTAADWLPPGLILTRQEGNDLGQRLSHALTEHFKAGYRHVLIIGSDCITHNCHSLLLGFAALEQHTVVLQPATDGGYTLVGLNRPVPELFEGISWGTETVLAESTAVLERGGIPYTLLPESYDLDTVADLRRLAESSVLEDLPYTRKWLRTFRDGRGMEFFNH